MTPICVISSDRVKDILKFRQEADRIIAGKYACVKIHNPIINVVDYEENITNHLFFHMVKIPFYIP